MSPPGGPQPRREHVTAAAPGRRRRSCFVYYKLSLMLFVAHPAWSYRLNADLEDHAEHEYITVVAEHPDWEHPVRIRVR